MSSYFDEVGAQLAALTRAGADHRSRRQALTLRHAMRSQHKARVRAGAALVSVCVLAVILVIALSLGSRPTNPSTPPSSPSHVTLEAVTVRLREVRDITSFRGATWTVSLVNQRTAIPGEKTLRQQFLKISAKHLAPVERSARYGVWLIGASRSGDKFLGFVAVQPREGHLTALSPLPSTGIFHEVEMTIEASQLPTVPGKVVLRGMFP